MIFYNFLFILFIYFLNVDFQIIEFKQFLYITNT